MVGSGSGCFSMVGSGCFPMFAYGIGFSLGSDLDPGQLHPDPNPCCLHTDIIKVIYFFNNDVNEFKLLSLVNVKLFTVAI